VHNDGMKEGKMWKPSESVTSQATASLISCAPDLGLSEPRDRFPAVFLPRCAPTTGPTSMGPYHILTSAQMNGRM
jgi:hypothetical protein